MEDSLTGCSDLRRNSLRLKSWKYNLLSSHWGSVSSKSHIFKQTYLCPIVKQIMSSLPRERHFGFDVMKYLGLLGFNSLEKPKQTSLRYFIYKLSPNGDVLESQIYYSMIHQGFYPYFPQLVFVMYSFKHHSGPSFNNYQTDWHRIELTL